jgi:hypothetical protein
METARSAKSSTVIYRVGAETANFGGFPSQYLKNNRYQDPAKKKPP